MDLTKVFNFLRLLAANNNREWFAQHKDVYLQAKKEVEQLIYTVGEQLVKTEPALQGFTDPSKCLFRIYRDVRFSPNKQPYKTHFGCFFAPGGKSSPSSGYYFHLEPENSFAGGGIWCPEPAMLKQIRQEIFYNTFDFLEIINAPAFKKYFSKLDESEMLRKNPAGFPSDFEHGALLRHKHYTVSSPLPEKILFSDKAADYIFDVFQAMKPFNDFLNAAQRENES